MRNHSTPLGVLVEALAAIGICDGAHRAREELVAPLG